jgi:hypothetical protein
LIPLLAKIKASARQVPVQPVAPQELRPQVLAA